ncbi:universal stress protein [Mycobacterium sp. 852002-51163_SCH5372311]|uniref:universal stress protein n=1 Tax=Mycobacterium sp. 852002-51163_SCH5372311 TaxID=1834097 RepID=UPI000800D6FD|nr:universal stress protein [Mycobacterium sp. 852002-51163_SCH5372311]OBF93800.1 universal stress protein [Mycobacterium sp. 852002-51163_SCH5372311]
MSETATGHGLLVAVDGSAASDAAVAWGTREAVMRDMPVTLLHVVAPIVVGWPVGRLYDDMPDWQNEAAQQVIAQARKVVEASSGESPSLGVHTEVSYANVVPALIEASKSAWMTVVGSTGLGAVGRALFGSVSANLIRHAHCPVAVIHADQSADHDAPVLVGIDGSPGSEAATAMAFDEASRRGVHLIALHAWSDVGVFAVLGMDWRDYEKQGHEILAERLGVWQERYPDVSVRRRVVCDQPARWLIKESEQAQLVAVGSRGRGGFADMLLGSVGAAVAQSASIPVIVVRSRSE